MGSSKTTTLFSLNNKLALLVSALVLIVLANQISKTIWMLLYPPTTTPIKSDNFLTSKNEENQIDYSLLLDYPLFGIPPVKPVAPPPPPPKEIPKVIKNRPVIVLSVIGIVSLGDLFLAIIRSGGVEETYSVGQYIGHLKIVNITRDSVIFDDEGQEAIAYLNQENVEFGGGTEEIVEVIDPANSNRTTKKTIIKKANAKSAAPVTEKVFRGKPVPVAKEIKVTNSQKEQLKSFKKTLATNPLQMLGKVNTVPYRQSGRIVGFQVSPGSEKELFFALQLQPGDVITQINGIDLSTVNNFTTGMALMNQLSKQNTLSMIVERRGANENIFVDFRN